MAGLYIHIPFCRKACVYCDFHFSTSFSRRAEMIDALCKEISLQKHFLGTSVLQSIYFGGGTPSILRKEELERLFHAISENFSVDENAEITLEANPDDLTPVKLEELAVSPVNRLSVGVQSFREKDLVMMNRSHNAEQAKKSILQAQEQGFWNISLDLIYALPEMGPAVWEEQVHQAIDLGVPHISSYALTVEPKTALSYKVKKGEIAEVADEAALEQFEILWQTLEAAGFEHYEVSNFARPGFEARHNASYWKGDPYLGIGPSAHSYNGTVRQWNVRHNALYLKNIEEGTPAFEKEVLTEKDRFNELVMTRLRTRTGLEWNEVKDRFPRFLEGLQREAQPLIEEGKLVSGTSLFIPRPWRFHSDGIAAALFYL